MWLQLYEVDTFIRRPGSGIVESRWGVLLPHEFFSCLACDFPDVWQELFCVPPDYWDHVARAADPWFEEHLLKDKVLGAPHKATPIRLFCDDTGLRKTRNVRVMHWFGEGSSAPTWRRKVPCYIVPMHQLVDDLTEGPLQEVVQWSMNALALGKWPMLDHTGQPWSSNTCSGPSAYRAKRAGDPLTPDHRFGIYTSTSADWKWHKENFKWAQDWSKNECCQRCIATKAGATNFAAFVPFAERSHQDYMCSIAARTSPLTQIIGFHLHTVLPELLHAGCLGVCQILNGCLLKEFADEGRWGAGPVDGKWQDRLDVKLAVAWDSFINWARAHNKIHTQRCFTSLRLSLRNRMSWPELKGKAHNALVVMEWLGAIAQRHDGTAHSELRACVAWGFNEFFHVVRIAGDWLSCRQLDRLRYTKIWVFDGYNKLSNEAARQGIPHYKIIPKHHVLFHVYLDMLRTGRNAGRLWTFSDEENMRNISQISCAVHPQRIGMSSLERWLMQFFA